MLTPEQARIRSFKVVPTLPEALRPLLDIARNLWWSWNPEAVELFVRLSGTLWRETEHNPVKLLGSCPQARLDEMAGDDAYIAAIQRVQEHMQAHLQDKGWFRKQYADADGCCVAYFSAEFGLTESLRIYSGGLGILAGDHLKSASELGLPLVAVGLLYRHGYFQQYLNADGWQQEFYPDVDFSNLPIQPVRRPSGERLRVHVDLPGRTCQIAVWEATVGKVRLFLLDTNLRENDPGDRTITAQLYGGDMENRIRQEIVLGIGGMRALEAMGIKPTVAHLNEGHAAFLALERIRMLIAEHNLSFDQARIAAAAANVFTTHTPVPAGIDRFPPDMVERYFRDYVPGLRLDMEGLLALGRENVANRNEFFSMAVLALRASDAANGVSKLHGQISREMWANIWPDLPAEEVPIGHVTNGVHARTWLSADLTWLFDRYLSRHWQTDPSDQSVWEGIDRIPDEELWRTHEIRRQRLVRWLRFTQKEHLERRGAGTAEIEQVSKLFKNTTLTIGFARRFATYKRANLILRDPQRLCRLLNNEKHPVQLVIAGKAHPADTQGKELIRQLVHFAHEYKVQDRVTFVENYNMSVARYLVQGCDVWLNNPRRGMEASGTSGMKAALNGVLNCSILDGWWVEGFETDLGWAIGSGETYTNYDYQDQVESQALYDLLENTIVPMFYTRDDRNLPRQWIAAMKKCMRTLAPKFNSNRQVQDYAEQYYIPAHRRATRLMADNLAAALELAAYHDHLRRHWHAVRIDAIEADVARPVGVRQPLDIAAVVNLGDLEPQAVHVQIYYGPADADNRIVGGQPVPMKVKERLGDGRYRYVGQVTAANSGRYGFAVRVIPGNPNLATPYIPGLIAWDRHTEAPPINAHAHVGAAN